MCFQINWFFTILCKITRNNQQNKKKYKSHKKSQEIKKERVMNSSPIFLYEYELPQSKAVVRSIIFAIALPVKNVLICPIVIIYLSLFNRYTFGQILRFIYITASKFCYMICQKLKRHDRQQRGHLIHTIRYEYHLIRLIFHFLAAFLCKPNDIGTSGPVSYTHLTLPTNREV